MGEGDGSRNIERFKVLSSCLVPHHRVGSDYKVYPTYDFATPFLDSKQGITLALQSSACHALYNRVLMEMELKEIMIIEFNGLVDGWDDPRYPTVQGVVRRGLKPEALYRFISEQDAPKRSTLMSWVKLWNINKKLIDPMVRRHKTYKGAGVKEITFTKSIWIDQADAMAMSVNREATLMDWGNAIVETITKDQEGIITAITGILHLEGCVSTTELKLTWLPKSSELVSLTLTEFGDLCSKREVSALGDSNMKHLECSDVVQLERNGYFRCDVPYHAEDNSLVLFAIPDGKTPSSCH
ncbi:hypothetical protein AALP_AA1G261600 [Arabis alpina]|uniref:Glutamyl/glutaminyl-tRNA synthetase class Ib anti-codon binding domain-containing protein n=1 Tax=Arabis alpina TaxID=50452 RepID=A0A087HQS7_ARAAL|nr:hypothetical protein AALP_AA1G261600 [Arabis alpina]